MLREAEIQQIADAVAQRLRPARLLDHAAVAELMGQAGVHHETVNRWAREGRIPKPVMGPGGANRWRADEIEAAIKAFPRASALAWSQRA